MDLASRAWEFYQRKIFTDIDIHIGKDVYKCHKIVICVPKSVFDCALRNGFEEATTNVINLNDNPCFVKVFPNLIRFLYIGDEKCVTKDNAMDMFQLASYLRITSLMDKSYKFLDKLEKKEVDSIVYNIDQYPLQLMPESLINSIARNFFHYVNNDKLIRLNVNNLEKLIQSTKLKIANEVQLIKFISRCIDHNDEFRNKMQIIKKSIKLEMLEQAQWAEFDTQLFEIEYSLMKTFHDDRSRYAEHPPKIVNFYLALKYKEYQDMINRYQPPIATFFTLGPDVFDNPESYISFKGFGPKGVMAPGVSLTITFNDNFFGIFNRFTLETNPNNIGIKFRLTPIEGRPIDLSSIQNNGEIPKIKKIDIVLNANANIRIQISKFFLSGYYLKIK